LSYRGTISLRKQIAFTFAAFLITWALLEAGTLVYIWVRPAEGGVDMQFLYQAHPYRAFAPVPNTMDGFKTRSFNSLGIRGPEISVEKPPDTIRIVCLGASTTYSDGATTDSHTYPARMEKVLREHYKDAPFRIEVINAGVQASNSLESLIYFQTRLLDLSPDIAILHHGINESWYMVEVPGFQSDYSHARHTFCLPPRQWWEFSPFLSFCFARRSLTNRYFPARFANLNWFILKRPSILWDWTQGRHGELEPRMIAAFERNIRNFVYVARGNGVIPVLSTQVFLDRRFDLWNIAVERLMDVIRDVAKREKVDLVDFARAMSWNPDVFYDACHLRDKPGGLPKKARIFAQTLIEEHVIERAWQRRREQSADQPDR